MLTAASRNDETKETSLRDWRFGDSWTVRSIGSVPVFQGGTN